jgi:hypothetical protein
MQTRISRTETSSQLLASGLLFETPITNDPPDNQGGGTTTSAPTPPPDEETPDGGS